MAPKIDTSHVNNLARLILIFHLLWVQLDLIKRKKSSESYTSMPPLILLSWNLGRASYLGERGPGGQTIRHSNTGIDENMATLLFQNSLGKFCWIFVPWRTVCLQKIFQAPIKALQGNHGQCMSMWVYQLKKTSLHFRQDVNETTHSQIKIITTFTDKTKSWKAF